MPPGRTIQPKNPEDGGLNPEDTPPIPRISRKYRLSDKGRANLAFLGRSRWATAGELDRRKAELDELQSALEDAGPEDLGLTQCDNCEGWFGPDGLAPHRKTVHPLERAVAEELDVSRSRVSAVWVEACRKQERHTSASPEQIIGRFWDDSDQRILKALRARGAGFRFAKTE